MAWVFLIIAGLFETAFAISLKYSDGFSKLVPTIAFLVFAAASFGLLNLALRELPIGSAYAVWTGIGAAGTAIIGMIFLAEPVTAVRIAGVALVVAGTVALQAGGGGH